jgi:hypothetical protein
MFRRAKKTISLAGSFLPTLNAIHTFCSWLNMATMNKKGRYDFCEKPLPFVRISREWLSISSTTKVRRCVIGIPVFVLRSARPTLHIGIVIAIHLFTYLFGSWHALYLQPPFLGSECFASYYRWCKIASLIKNLGFGGNIS